MGAKTTNARGNAFQTPGKGSVKSTQKPVSPRLRRPKVKIHQAEAVSADAALEEPDIEYMPPRSVPLPDYPDNLHNLDYSAIFKRENMISDIWSGLRSPVKSEQEHEEAMAKAQKRSERQILRAIAADPILGNGASSLSPSTCDDEADVSTNRSKKGPSTLASKTAVAALSKPAPQRPRFAAPTASTKARAPLSVQVSKKPSSVLPPSAKPTADVNHAAATATSRSTLGYSKGRAVSASARKPISEAHRAEVVRRPATAVQQQDPIKKTGLEYLLQDDPELEEMLKRSIADAGQQDGIVDGVAAMGLIEEDEDELKDFQLEVPEF